MKINRKYQLKFIAVLVLLLTIPFGAAAYASDYDPEAIPTEKPVFNPMVKLVTPTVVDVSGGSTEVFGLSFRNTGSGTAQNLVIQPNISADAPFTVEFLDHSKSVQIGTSGTKKLKLQIKVDKSAASGTYPVTLSYTYKNAYNENFTETDILMVRVENVALGPDLRLYEFNVDTDSIASGDSFALTAYLENISTQTAYDTTITIEGLDTDGIYLNNSTDNAYVKTFEPGHRSTITFDMKAASKAKSGTYTLNFKVTYKDSKGEAHTKEYTYYVTVGSTSSDSKGDIQITNISTPTATFGVGEEFTIAMDIANTGTADAKNVKVSATTDEAGAIVPKTANVRMIQTLASGATERLEFRFAPTSKSQSQNYTIGFQVEYETGEENADGTPETATFSQYAGVNAYNPDNDDDDDKDKDKISIPKIIVSEYKVEPLIVSAGQEFDLDLTFLNTHGSKTIENVKAYLIMEDKSTSSDTTEDKGNVFSPVNGSNTFYIDRIGPKGEARQHLRMFCIPDASAKTYTISVKFEYQDSEYNTYTEEALIGITVKQATRLETSDISMGSSVMMYETLPINFQLYNMGKVTLSNMMVTIDAPGFDTISTESTVYYGKFNPSESNYYDGVIIAQEAGTQTVNVVISYEDDSMEKHEVVREFTVVVEEPFMPSEEDFYPEDFDARPSQGGIMGVLTNKFVWIGVVLAIVAIGGGSVFFLKKKKQKGMDFDE